MIVVIPHWSRRGRLGNNWFKSRMQIALESMTFTDPSIRVIRIS